MTFSTQSKLLAALTAAACLGLAGCNKPADPSATSGTSTSPSPSTTPMPTEPTSTGGLPSAASAASATPP